MIDWSRYDTWKLEAPSQDASPKCAYVKCDNPPKHGEDYCKSCIENYACHKCDQIKTDENDWMELYSGFYACRKCYEKIIG